MSWNPANLRKQNLISSWVVFVCWVVLVYFWFLVVGCWWWCIFGFWLLVVHCLCCLQETTVLQSDSVQVNPKLSEWHWMQCQCIIWQRTSHSRCFWWKSRWMDIIHLCILSIQGSLHPERMKHLSWLVEIENGWQGCCMAFGLGRIPHYQFSSTHRSSSVLQKTVRCWNVPSQRLGQSLSHTIANDNVVVINNQTDEFGRIAECFNKLPFYDFFCEHCQTLWTALECKSKANNATRATLKWLFGFSGQNLCVPDGEIVAAPWLLMGTDKRAIQCMETMTSLLEYVLSISNLTTHPFDSDSDSEQNERFAGSLTSDNKPGISSTLCLLVSQSSILTSPPTMIWLVVMLTGATTLAGTVHCVDIGYLIMMAGFIVWPSLPTWGSWLATILIRRHKWPTIPPTYTSISHTTKNNGITYTPLSHQQERLNSFHLLISSVCTLFSLDAIMRVYNAWNGLSSLEALELLLPVLFMESMDRLSAVY